jgi:chaperonin GroES
MNQSEMFTKYISSPNIAEHLDEDLLTTIGQEVSDGYKSDLESRSALEELLDKWTKLALQVTDKKTYPWRNASNVKYPLLATAAMQFSARAYPTLVPSNGKVVKCKMLGYDPTGEKLKRAERVGKYMSYQVMDVMEEWEEEMDKLLITLPICGTVFKKSYFDPGKRRNVSCVVMPKSLVVNYWAKSLEDAERVTEIIPLSKRRVMENKNLGLFLDVDLASPIGDSSRKIDTTHELTEPAVDNTTPYTFLEQHTYLDLDEDGYGEPYIVTVEEQSKKVVRIVARYDEDSVKMDEDEKLLFIEPVQYYTKYGFIPNPDGGFYDIGFGRLLGSINESVDTLINQLIDSGTLSNLQSGFLGKGLRVKLGDYNFTPGEWKTVNSTGDDLKKAIFPLPVREPSAVLMQLLQYLVTSGKELASVAEIFVGKMPGQNTPATTTMASIEQGMKVFTAVYKRIYRSMAKEFQKLYLLNRNYANPQEYVSFLDQPIQQEDFQGPADDIIPAADPNAVSSQEKQAKVQAVGQLLQLGTLNPMEYTKMYLEAFEIEPTEQLVMQPQPQPDPKAQAAEQQAALAKQVAEHKMAIESAKDQRKSASMQQKEAIDAQISKRKILNEAIMGNIKVGSAAAQAAVGLQAAKSKAALAGKGNDGDNES